MERIEAYDLLDMALHFNKQIKESLTVDEVVYMVSQYIDSNYEHNFYMETTDEGDYFPFLYEHIHY